MTSYGFWSPALGSWDSLETGFEALSSHANCDPAPGGGAHLRDTQAPQSPLAIPPAPAPAYLTSWRPCPASPSQSGSGRCRRHRLHTYRLPSWTPLLCHSRQAEARGRVSGRRLPCPIHHPEVSSLCPPLPHSPGPRHKRTHSWTGLCHKLACDMGKILKLATPLLLKGAGQ